MERICIICQQVFTVTPQQRKYCAQCQKIENYDETKGRLCRLCGNPLKRIARPRATSLCYQCYRENALKGPAHPRWKGGRQFDKQTGYIYIHNPDGSKKMEHRLIWEKAHGKKLPEHWAVHHLNGIKTDNRPDNLWALNKGDHGKAHAQYIKALQKRIRELEQLRLNL